MLGVVENMSGLSVPVESEKMRFTSGPDGPDVTEQVRAILAQHMPQAAPLTAHMEVFTPSRGRH